jgi:hypothetical protein
MKCFFLILSFLCNDIIWGQSIKLSPEKLVAVNVNISSANYKGKKAIRIIGTGNNSSEMALIKNLDFANGTIEIDVSGDRLPDKDSSFRGFIGIAFRVQQADSLRYECFYLRPTNARSEDQLRKNHSTQYISEPEYPWYRLRKEAPGVYESYTDMEAAEWTHIKIVVKDKRAWLFVNHASQPCLIVNDLKKGLSNGAVALWIGPGTDGYFSDMKISKQ